MKDLQNTVHSRSNKSFSDQLLNKLLTDANAKSNEYYILLDIVANCSSCISEFKQRIRDVNYNHPEGGPSIDSSRSTEVIDNENNSTRII